MTKQEQNQHYKTDIGKGKGKRKSSRRDIKKARFSRRAMPKTGNQVSNNIQEQAGQRTKASKKTSEQLRTEASGYEGKKARKKARQQGKQAPILQLQCVNAS